MVYGRPNHELLEELSNLHLFWYIPAAMLNGRSVTLDLEYQKRRDEIRAKYAASSS